MFVVDLTRQVFIAGQDEVAVLASRMVGRMTPESRRHLRNRLMFFYGRTEATDAEQLDGMGSPFDR